MLEKIKETAGFLESKISGKLEFGMITGTGLGSLTKQMGVDFRIPYSEIPNFPVSTVEGHAGALVVGRLAGKGLIAMEGRFHLYEGYSPMEITFPVRVLAMLGVKYLLISSAAGGLNPEFKKGDLMVVSDHINMTGTNPLIGPNLDEFGPRFPDMTSVYDPQLIDDMRQIALEAQIHLRQGIYAGVVGPSMETPAETRFLRMAGADAVGMSTVSEAIVASHCGMKLMTIVVITNVNLPDCMEKTSVESVVQTANDAGADLSRLWVKVLEALKPENTDRNGP